MNIHIIDEGAVHAEPLAEDSVPDKRWPEGWYIMPALCLSFVLWGLAIYGLIHLFH